MPLDPVDPDIAALKSQMGGLAERVGRLEVSVELLTQGLQLLSAAFVGLTETVADLQTFVGRLQAALPDRPPCKAWEKVPVLKEK